MIHCLWNLPVSRNPHQRTLLLGVEALANALEGACQKYGPQMPSGIYGGLRGGRGVCVAQRNYDKTLQLDYDMSVFQIKIGMVACRVLTTANHRKI